ncbi:MAG: EamA family transporter [Chloroflexi bacterium]|jgi:drug/metabolite transporter (DMT)-like permease|nr:EamA family transporter [Chloroflexota bacterium]
MGTSKSPGGTAASGLPDTSVLLAFILAVFLAGANAVAVRFTVAELAPFWGATMRFAAAAAIFAVIGLIGRVALPRGRVLGGVLIYGILGFGLSYALLYFAIRELTAGFTMVILALTPLLTFLFAVLHRLEPFRWRALLGTLLAVAGIALAFTGQAENSVPLWAVLFMAGAAACFAESTVVLKMLPPVSPMAVNAVGMGAATVLLAVLSLVAGEAWVLPQQAQTWTAVFYLVIFGSVLLFYLVVYVIQHWTATASSYLVVLTPFVTVPLGALLAGEKVTVGLVLGAVLVLAAVFVGALSGHPDEKAGTEAPATETR